MKLRTKFQDEDFDLGEVVDADVATTPDGFIKFQAEARAGGRHTIFYDTLERLHDDWEDAPEPKGYWYIRDDGSGVGFSPLDYSSVAHRRLIIGNYFESEEEAKRAVEKLKAWQRLKDKGIEFYGWRRNQTGTYDLLARWEDRIPRSYEIKIDLDLLFGGEE